MGDHGGMLSELSIRNIGVIDEVTLELPAGLVVLTGETGAGKTMVVSALDLLLGGRADAERVRAGAGTAVVEARLVPAPPAAREWTDGDDELIVRREIAAEGGARSKVRINGRMAPVSALSACVGGAVELHGQSDSARLADRAVQRRLLDRYGGEALAKAAAAYDSAFDAWRAAAAELDELQTGAQERAREADRLRFELAEIDAVAPEPADATELPAELRRLEHAETLTASAATATAAVNHDGGARDGLAAAAAALRAMAGIDADLDALADRVDSVTVEVQELGLDIAAYAEGLEVDPLRLEHLRDREAALTRLSRKYGAGGGRELDPDGVVAYAEDGRARLEQLEGGDERAEGLAEALVALESEMHLAAEALRAQRVAAGEQLSTAVNAHLAELGMAGATFSVRVEKAEPSRSGADDLELLLSANAGEPALSLAKAASGGERSRVALAIRAALADADDTPVLVFDEVDAGIGGETALAVGRMLARLAAGRQVLCVTHLAQLAAFADAHFVVSKSTENERTVASLQRLDTDARVVELSRMLSGTPTSERAVQHAAELLELAGTS